MDTRRIRIPSASYTAACSLLILASAAHADSSPQELAGSVTSAAIPHPANEPAWFMPAYLHALRSPLPAARNIGTTPPVIPQFGLFLDAAGLTGNYQPGGPVTTAENAFFQPMGTNGRACVTCHQPADALSVSTSFIRTLFVQTKGRDPLFAPVDGANCPNRVPAAETDGALLGGLAGSGNLKDVRAAHSLLLDKGLFRIFLPVPKQTTGVNPHPVEYTIELVSDPNGCNTDPAYNQVTDPVTGELSQIISVYRRPLITANLRFKLTTIENFIGTPPGLPPLPIDPFTGLLESLNIMWDGREPTLQSQASNAVLIHSQATVPPTAAQVAQMVAFQNGIFTAQERLGLVSLSQGANGGARHLSTRSVLTELTRTPPFDEFSAWNNLSPTTPVTALQASVARGQTLFNEFRFDFTVGRFIGRGCASCHGQLGGGSEIAAAGQRNTGVGGQSVQLNGPAPDPALPVFKLTCVPNVPVGADGPVVITNDPGLALITGKCEDIGSFTVPTIRGLAARPPYFHDGSAATVRDIVDFYDRRFSIGFTAPQKQDLVNFLNAL